MAKAQYIGVSGVARKAPKEYIGVAGVARKVTKGYIGVNGVARQYFSGGTPISSVAVGGTVKVAENGTPVDYIVVQIGTPNSTAYANCDGYWLLRKNATATTGDFVYDDDNDPFYDYNRNWTTVTNSSITNVIRPREVAFYNSYPAKLRSLILDPTLPLYYGTRFSENVSAPKYVFHLGLYEIHYLNGTTDGEQTLTYFANANIWKNKASPDGVAYNDNGAATAWWIRDSDGYGSSYCTYISANGGLYRSSGKTSAGYRPCFIVPKTIKLEDLL